MKTRKESKSNLFTKAIDIYTFKNNNQKDLLMDTSTSIMMGLFILIFLFYPILITIMLVIKKTIISWIIFIVITMIGSFIIGTPIYKYLSKTSDMD